MKRTCLFIFSFIGLFLFFGCKTQYKYVPLESVKVEYKEVYSRDSIYLHDSIYVKDKGDTLITEVYRFLYRDKIIRDSVYIQDSIPVPYPVEIEIPRNYITGWQNFQIWCGRLMLIIFSGYLIVLYFKKKTKL